MWTRKGVLFLGGGVILLLLALVTKNLQVALIGISLLSYLIVTSFMHQFLQIAPTGKYSVPKKIKDDADLVISREVSADYTFEDNDLIISLKLKNNKRRSLTLELFDKLPSEVKLIKGSNYLIVHLKPGADVTYKYTIQCPLMGPYEIGPIVLRSGDVSNMFFREEEIDIISDFLVLPKVEDISHLKVYAKVPKLFSGAMSFKQPGEGSEFYSLREYVPGDPFKNINWKAYSKTGTLMVNEHEWEAIHDITIFLDAREASGIGFSNQNPLLLGCRAAASLASFFMSMRNSVGLVVYGEGIYRETPRSGDSHLIKMLSALAGAKPKGDMPLRAVADTVLPHITARSPIVLVSDLQDDETLIDAVSYIAAMGHHLTVVSVPAHEIEFKAGKIAELERETHQLERNILQSTISSYGARFIDWSPDKNLYTLLMEVLI